MNKITIILIFFILNGLKSTGFAQQSDINMIRNHVHVLSSDTMLGRETATRGEKISADYLVSQYKKVGLKPFGVENTYLQDFPVLEYVVNTDETFLKIFEEKFLFPMHFKRIGGGGSFKPQHFEGNLVVVQGLIEKPEDINMEIMKDAIVYYDMPKDSEGNFLPQATRALFTMASSGAKTFLIPSGKNTDQWKEVWENREKYLIPSDKAGWPLWTDQKKETTSISFFEVSDTIQKTLHLPEYHTTEPNFIKTSIPVALKTVIRLNKIKYGHNILGYIEGTDKNLKQQAIVITAHYDGLGIVNGQQKNEDSIYNGADDNASGVAAMLEVARILRQNKPKHSVIFAAVSGEEKGLWGSIYFLKHFPFSLMNIKANLNMDMIGKPYNSKSIYLIGLEELILEGKFDKSTYHSLEILNNNDFDKDFPGQHLYYRSDHINFVREGIPAIFFHAGLHDFYHEPSDEIEIVDFNYLKKATDLVYQIFKDLDQQKLDIKLIRNPKEIMKDWHLAKD